MSPDSEVRAFVRTVDTAFLPATRHTSDPAVLNRGAGRTSEGERRVVMHARVLKEALWQRPEIADSRIKSLYDGCFAEVAALVELEAAYRADRLYRRDR